MQKELSLAVATASAAIFLTACGDENTTNITETTGIAVVAAGDSLPACGEENVGEIVFAEDSAQVYYCADGKWTTLKGEQGEAGKDGENGSDGSSCTATPVDGGIEVRCDGEVVGVIANGKDGTDGEEGSDGKGCIAEAIENGYKILCGGDSIGVLLNGEQGEKGEQGERGIQGENGSGCKIADLGDGVVEVTCGEGENASTTTLYKAMCGAAAYDPATQICADDYIYELCGTSSYDPATHMCLDNQIVSVCSESLDGEKITVNGVSYLCWEQEWIEEKENWQYLNPAISYEMFKDARDGQIYKSVKIGNQVWMAENLNYDYNEGTAKSYCYNDEQESCAKYGRLYTWAAAMDSAGVFGDGGKGCGYDVMCSAKEPVRGVCPESWHLPSDTEWKTLFTAVGGTTVAGTKLKSKSGWYNNGNGTDEYGFSGVPAGNRDREGLYNDAGKGARFWSSTERGSFPAYLWIFSYGNTTVSSGYHDKFFGYSIRCIKD
ncbi:MAG: FISUMP domain-containing protein [Fibrobacter intestinalis]|uniref:fibrobacter succinogenes major paralogous domain-containing protein n=1 Tax=Fibrobacter intestinalis TaxID=28122 RepID=UPI003F03F0B0